MAYEARMQADILALLRLFRDHVLDAETHQLVVKVATDADSWNTSKEVFRIVRARNLEGIKDHDHARECQYCFEEVCLQSLYNATAPSDPFDPCTPHWIIRIALDLASVIGVSTKDVANVLCRPTAS